MSYIVLARKWRPQTFDDLTGQETVVRTLKNALSSEKTAHAYLFSGPRGVGKTSAARVLAKALNCTQRSSPEPCCDCNNCKAIANGSSVDVLEIDGASNTSVDNIRELRETVRYAPSSGKFKIYIIDEVHMLSTAAFNALLKTLEEPPPHIIFVFATTEPKKVPVTILSRCQHHAFRKISKPKIKERITKITKAENITTSDTAAEMIARAADGSMRDALTLLDQASSFSSNISEKDLQTVLGLPESDIIIQLSDTILSGDISGTLSFIKDITERGYDLRPIMKELVEHFRNIAISKVIQKPDEFLELSQEEMQKLQQQASMMNIEELTLFLTEILKLEAEVKSSVNPRYTLELGFLKASFIRGIPSISDILKKLNDSANQSIPDVSGTKIDTPSGDTTGNEKQEVPDIQNKDKLWSEVIKKLKGKDHLLAYKLAHAKVLSISKETITLGLNGGMSVLADSIKKNALLLESALKEITGHTMRLKIVSLPEEKKPAQEIKDTVLSNSVVKNAIDLFNGRILDVKSLEQKDSTD
ncbi:MAG: DNA polymerase III subunit gamma/tau [Nitrospiraceae bacterium]|nr:MAG: DNA polymerase III subunit gamma/tau [Nitrospiraceae bacterium]